MESDEDSSFCFSHLEDDLQATFASPLFVEDSTFTNLFQQLDSHCEPTDSVAARENSKPLVVVGECGVGKSAALATWAARRKSNAPPTRRLDYAEYIFWHAIGCTRNSIQVIHLLRRLVNELIDHFELKEAVDLADEKLSWILPRLLDRASKRGRVIIVVDGGLQHICSNDKDYGLKWLPLNLPNKVRMILSATTPTEEVGNKETTDYTKKLLAKVQQTWDEIQRRKWPILSLECLQSASVANFISSYLALSSTHHCQNHEMLLVERKQIIEIISAHQRSTNPLFLTFMLRGICLAISTGYNVNQCLVAWMPCRTVAELIEHMLCFFESGMPRRNSLGTSNANRLGSLLGDSLSLLFVARHGLHENELFQILGRVKQQSRWNRQTEGTVVPVKLKILKMLMQKKNRLIDVFRSFDTDGNGTLSHEEFYTGMERLEINVSHDEVTLLINEVDNNGDGEIDYQETLDHFEHLARSYSHGKRRVSVFERNAETKEVFSLTNEDKQYLIRTLRCVGVRCLEIETGCILTLPFEITALRDVVWKKYIMAKNENNETKCRSFIIDFFSKKEPSWRFSEELPWHLKKGRQWHELKKILVDLRTLDLMFNNSELKSELFNYLRVLSVGGKIKFDIIREYNRSMDRWVSNHNPSSRQISLMSHFIANVMAWFSTSIAGLTKSPPFMREGLDDADLRSMGVDLLPGRERIDSAGSKMLQSRRAEPEAQYFFNRWIWIQFPWLALKSASMNRRQHGRQSKDNESDTPRVENGLSPEPSIGLRDKSMIRARISEPSALLKLSRIESMEPKKKNQTVIPFSSGTTWEHNVGIDSRSSDDSSRDNAVKQLQELKHIHDSLAVEADSKEKQFSELENVHRARQVGNMKSQNCIVDGEAALRELQTRLDKINDLIETASGVELVFQDILLALHNCDPTTQNQHLRLEQQIVLSKQQSADLQQERGAIVKEIEKIEARSMKVSSAVNLIIQERQRIKPDLETLRVRANEESQRRKTARVKSFDPAAFSRRMRLEGRIAKRRETKLKRNQNDKAAEFHLSKKAELHPMERLAQAAGTRDPASIVKVLTEGDSQRLRARQERCEVQVKEQSATLESLLNKTKELSLVDSGAKTHSTRLTDEDVDHAKVVLSRKQKRLDAMSQLVQKISLVIINLDGMVEPTERVRRFSEFAQITQAAARLSIMPNVCQKQDKRNQDVKRLARFVKSLHNEIPSEMNLLAKKESGKNDQTKYQNVRIWRREEQESIFAKEVEQLHDVEGEDEDDYEQNTDEDFGKLASYVNQGIHTNDCQNQQRRANLLSHAKQGKYASKGMILEAVMQSEQTKNQSP